MLSRVAALALGALIPFGCEEPDKPGPEEPGITPPTPAGDYFKLMINLSREVPDDYEVIFNADADGTTLIVETNLAGWAVSSDAAWCKVDKTEETMSAKATVVITVGDYDTRDENGLFRNLAARKAQVTVSAPGQKSKSIRVVQQGRVYFNYTDEYQWDLSLFSYVLEISAGGQRDAHIVTNCYKWTPSTDASWLTVERIDQVTLRLSSQPRADGDGLRKATVTVSDSNDDFQHTSFVVIERTGGLSGHDYDYDDTYPWDE